MVKVKICGLTRVEDARTACEAGADMIGVIVNAKVPTPRNLDYRDARRILDDVFSGVKKVAVGMPVDLAEGLEIVEELDPDYLQIHSSPPLSEVRELRETTGKKIISTLSLPRRVMELTDLITLAQKVAEVSDFILLDTKSPLGGGSGKTHDWSASRKLRESLDMPIFLAGGLNPLNVQEAIRKVQPFGVDVSSGVEATPGTKDPERIRAFVKASRKT